MDPRQTLVLYLFAGLCVGLAFALRSQRTPAPKAILVVASLIFWPLLVPLLLAPGRSGPDSTGGSTLATSSRLRAAMAGLDGVAQELAIPEIERVRAQASSFVALEGRLAEMDRLLQTSDFDRGAAERTLAELLQRGLAENDARVTSVRGRLRNIDRLQTLRQESEANVERVCLQLEEITAQLKLMRVAGRSSADDEAVAAVRQVADAMQAVTEEMLPGGASA